MICKYVAPFLLLLAVNSLLAQQDAVNAEITKLPFPDEIEYTLPRKGEVRGHFINGLIHYKGRAANGRLQGAWQSWYENNNPCDSGTFSKGIPDGTWQVWYTDGQVQFIRTYSADRWQRFLHERLRYHPKRTTTPLVNLLQENNEKAEWFISPLHSFCSQSSCSGDAAKNILQQLYHNSSGKHYHPLFEKGLLHGLFINYFPDGAVRDSGNYENGLPHGLWIHHAPGRENRWSGYYHHGEKDKEWKLYDHNGRLVSISNYNKGKELWRKDLPAKAQ